VTDIRPPNKRPLGLIVAAVIETWTAAYTAVTAPNTLTEYRSLFAGFGGELPGATKLLLAAPYLWLPFALVSIAILVWIGRRDAPTDAERKRMRRVLWIFGAVFGLTVAWAGYALYLPLFKLSAVV